MFGIQKVTTAHLETLLTLSRDTFFYFFASLNESANMEAYAAVAFTQGRMLAEITNPESEFYFALEDDEITGYVKLNFGNAQTEFKDKNALEVERIYVLGEHHGKHVGSKLLNFAIQTGKSRQLEYIWLGVWEHNYKAIGFYEHHGFSIFSSHEFMLGADRQTDLLMKKVI